MIVWLTPALRDTLKEYSFLWAFLKNVFNVAIPPEVTVHEPQQQTTNSLFVPHVNRDGNGK